jgi:hypothetical protein
VFQSLPFQGKGRGWVSGETERGQLLPFQGEIERG